MKNTILLCLLIIPLELFCCTFTPDSFCATILGNTEKIIVYGTIISKDEDGLDLEVIDLIEGEETKSLIRIWDGRDFDCNGLFDMSTNLIGEINDTIIISLPRIFEIENPWDVIGDYTRPNPYGDTPRLFVNNGIATGFIAGSHLGDNIYEQKIKYENLKESIMTHGDCTDIMLITSTDRISFRNEIDVQNPVSTMLTINQSQSTEIVEVNIYSLKGEKLISKRTMDQLQIVISVAQIPNGLYIVQMITSSGAQESIKIVKN